MPETPDNSLISRRQSSKNKNAAEIAPQKLTPMMRQYLELKEANPDSILLFRLGDFYEMFFDDAEIASALLEITLTSRDKGKDAVPMCGVPWHSAAGYIQKLVEGGHKVAVCEQTEDPKEAKGIVRREVVKVVTPGLVTDTDMLDAKTSRFLMAAAPGKRSIGFAYADVTTGEFRIGEAPDWRAFSDEAARVEPSEILIPEDVEPMLSTKALPGKIHPTALKSADFKLKKAYGILSGHFGVADLNAFGVGEFEDGIRAAGALLSYVESNCKSGLANLRRLSRHAGGEAMMLDETTKRNLELFRTMWGGRKDGALIHLLDRTRTAMGGRKLREWTAFPLLDPVEINYRLDAVSELTRRGDTRKKIRDFLKSVYDVARLSGKAAMETANAKDLLALKKSLQVLPELGVLLSDAEADLLKRAGSDASPMPEMEDLLERAIAEDPPPFLTEGGLIKEGFDAEVDELISIRRDGRGWIAKLQAEERKRTGISSLKVGFNKVFGYYLEVTRANLGSIPDDYQRRQTLANAERFITPELKEMESKVLGAEDKAKALEYKIFVKVRSRVAEKIDDFRRLANALAILDVLAGLADLAVEMGYVRPAVGPGRGMDVKAGRHPVVEKTLASSERFVPNDVSFDPVKKRLIIITGPNMAGKSTILRQTALIALMAQMGSFVPAESAELGIVDRIFTRVGASDDLAGGRSTFMVEMTETANILHNATDRSLVILDEIGRGTSTFDGLSIAWAVAERMHEIGARTMFATHYHELTDLEKTLDAAANYNVAVKDWEGKIIFLRRLVEGGASRSYGIQVAKLAGLPDDVIKRAGEVLENIESGELDEAGVPTLAHSAAMRPPPPQRQLDLFRKSPDACAVELAREIAAWNIEATTPMEALLGLQKLRERALELLKD